MFLYSIHIYIVCLPIVELHWAKDKERGLFASMLKCEAFIFVHVFF